MNYKKKIITILSVIIIYLTYSYGGDAISRYLLHPWITPHLSKTLLHLDSGRYLGRIINAIWATFLFIAVCFFQEKSLKQSILTTKHPFRFFLYGAIFALILVMISIAVTIMTHSLSLQIQQSWQTALAPSILIYISAMIMTAYAEELIMRGLLLNTLLKAFNPHLAIVSIGLVFAYIHLHYSLMYAIGAFFAGLILGYGFVYTKSIYFCFGWHFCWNFISSMTFNQQLFTIRVYNSVLAGQRNITPDREGVISLIVVIIGFIAFFIKCKLWQLYQTRNKQHSECSHPYA
jgi:membrane protease YdiL (CAAX protease family)